MDKIRMNNNNNINKNKSLNTIKIQNQYPKS